MTKLSVTTHHQTPSVDEYCQMRAASGLSPKSKQAASIGLPNSLFSVCIREPDGALVAMGRLIGDGGCFVQVCDIAVRPGVQGQGLGRLVMQELMDYVEKNVPNSAWVNLFADGTANQLYAKFGFEFTAPESLGMAVQLQ